MAIAAIAGLAGPAAAQDGPFKLKRSPFHVIAASPATIGEVRTAQPGDEVLQANLGFGQVALLQETQSISVSGLRFDASATEMLRGAASVTPDSRIAQGARIYCSGQKVLTREERQDSADRGARFERDVSLCLIDQDDDDRFDQGFVHGAKWIEDQRLTAITPVGYRELGLTAIPGTRLKITYEKGAALQGAILSMESNLMNGKFAYAAARIGPVPEKAPLLHGERGIKGKYPRTLTYGDAQVTILGLDPKTRILTYRIDRGFETRPTIVKIGYYGMYGSTEYTFE